MGVKSKREGRREKGEGRRERKRFERELVGEKTRVTSLEAERARELCESTRAVQEQVKRVEAVVQRKGT